MPEIIDKERTIIIGNKPESVIDTKTGDTINTEPYLRSILLRLMEFDYIYIKTQPQPEKLAKISSIYEILQWFGVRELKGDRKFAYESWNPNKEKVKVIIIKWQIIPRLLKYREELMSEMQEEDKEFE